MEDFYNNPIQIDNTVMENDIIPNGISFRLGNKIARFSFVEDETITLEDEIKNEYINQYKSKINDLNQELETRTNQLKTLYDRKTRQIDALKDELSTQLKRSNIMPEITYDHFRRGLSIVKDYPGQLGSLVWIYRGEYNVKYLNNRRIEEVFSNKKLKKDVIVQRIKKEKMK